MHRELRLQKNSVSLVLGVYWAMYGQKSPAIGLNSHQR
jgi:hypothetical protein